MDREVRWAESAANDLEEIAKYLAKDSEAYAASVVAELYKAARSLSKLSERGRMVPEYREPNVRELIIGKYRLVYEVADRLVFVLRIIHGAQPLPDRL